MAKTKKHVIGIIGNPNCGKSTIFNALTGAKQYVGNWPGVTVERKTGEFSFEDGEDVEIVDTPGIYSLTATSEDEKAAFDYVMSREAEMFIDVVDATALERNLYLTMQLAELKIPVIVVVTMMDIARQRKLVVDLDHLSEHLGVPVIGINANKSADIKRFQEALHKALKSPSVSSVRIEYPNEIEHEIDVLSSACVKTAEALRVLPRWLATRALESDAFVIGELNRYHDMAPEVVEGARNRVIALLKDEPDMVMADTRYGVIAGLVKDVVENVEDKIRFSEKLDKVVLNRFLGIPIFFGMMYIVFWFTQVVGGAFIDFFDIAGDTLFVSGTAHLLGMVNAPGWVVALLANGVGSALQTVGTFLPPIGFMFLCLSMLEDSGYMARAAFVMDRFMRWIGLPGKSFVPMLVGFGCSVPAIMATRTLESKRDRFLSVFMTPFMSCGAKLPVWVLFAAAFTPEHPGKLVFLMYATGIVLGIITGLILKHTLFQGEPSHFIMELPPYHMPRPRHIFFHTWERLKVFIFRAGKFIVPMVLVLGLLNSIGTDGSIGKEDTDESLLSVAGKAITPVFEPIGVERENWPASVAIFTGLFAKESVIGTMKGLYGQIDAAAGEGSDGGDGANEAEAVEEYSLIGGLKDAVASIGENLSGVWHGFVDPLGMQDAQDEAAGEEGAEVGNGAIGSLRRHFPKGFHQVFSFLLFILLYVPCLAATGVVFREIGKFYGAVFVGYLTVLGWSVATVYHAVMVSGSTLWLFIGLSAIAAMFVAFYFYGRRHKVDMI